MMKISMNWLILSLMLTPWLTWASDDGLSAEAIRDKVVENNSFGFNNARS